MHEKSPLSASAGRGASKRIEPDVETAIEMIAPVERGPWFSVPSFRGSYSMIPDEDNVVSKKSNTLAILLVSCLVVGAGLGTFFLSSSQEKPVDLGAAWSSKAAPFSTFDPRDLGFLGLQRPDESKPGAVFGDLSKDSHPLPTNSWYENFLLGAAYSGQENKVFQVPYILDTAGPIAGVRTHPCHVQADSRSVMMTYELVNGVTLGSKELEKAQYIVKSQGKPAITKLAIELQWNEGGSTTSIASPIVRGSPYVSMTYKDATPRIYAERPLKQGKLFIDDSTSGVECAVGKGNHSRPFLVTSNIKIELDQSDMTWLIFPSRPMHFVCSHHDDAAEQAAKNWNLPPGVSMPDYSFTDISAVEVQASAMVRIAMANNCTTGQNVQYCGTAKKPRDQSQYEALLKRHADTYPTAKADVEFTFPVQSSEEEELRLIFNWHAASMKADFSDAVSTSTTSTIPSIGDGHIPETELLMFALPHHQERIQTTLFSSSIVLDQSSACQPTIHGMACPLIGGSWSLLEHLHRTNFSAIKPIRSEMRAALVETLENDLTFTLPRNYQFGAGDTYFSGKLLARLARIILIADDMGFSKSDNPTHQTLFTDAVDHLQAGVEIWLNGSAESPFLYDESWRGLIMCGCDYAWDKERQEGHCANVFSAEDTYHACPALADQGQNFGAGFYNDHHYHFGYHIYAAAVLSRYRWAWAERFIEHVLVLVRDIANPSEDDNFFPTWRHKDWYLGFSWASGIVTIGNRPYPNGRNQESVSEAIAAYEAIALLGDVMQDNYARKVASLQAMAPTTYAGLATVRQQLEIAHSRLDSGLRIRDMGRLLMATEIRSAKTYWHVQTPSTANVSRIYPDVYEPKIVGMIWSMMVQEQTWFGNEVWKSYGIQMLPLTVAAEIRDDVSWVAEMLPLYQESCEADPVCMKEGWSVLLYTSAATLGRWEEAWAGINALPEETFDKAGANGHSRSNSLWYIATR